MNSKHTHSLSVVYAVHNEAHNLARSLESIKDLADEIIIVDGESSDDTVRIAKEYKAKVIETTNKPIFHINKQMAMDEAKGEWTLQMDADEVVDKEMQKDIVRIVNGDVSEMAAGYWLRRKNYFLGRFLTKGGQYPDPVIRFYQTGKAFLPMKSVHEQMEVKGEVGWLEGHLLHYSSPSFSEYLRKMNTYTTLTALEWQKEKRAIGLVPVLQNFIIRPIFTFCSLYFRHKGFMDGFAGFLFALFSGLHFSLAYIKYWEMKQQK
jgi:glycosyltransferase involved in cell wall biosynthesis